MQYIRNAWGDRLVPMAERKQGRAAFFERGSGVAGFDPVALFFAHTRDGIGM
jgi:hypothetical protein